MRNSEDWWSYIDEDNSSKRFLPRTTHLVNDRMPTRRCLFFWRRERPWFTARRIVMGFFDEVLRIREQGYVPTKTDVLRAKQKIRVFHKPVLSFSLSFFSSELTLSHLRRMSPSKSTSRRTCQWHQKNRDIQLTALYASQPSATKYISSITDYTQVACSLPWRRRYCWMRCRIRAYCERHYPVVFSSLVVLSSHFNLFLPTHLLAHSSIHITSPSLCIFLPVSLSYNKPAFA